MKVLKINENKVKILLDLCDMERFGISTEKVDLNDKSYREGVLRVLCELESGWGFIHKGQRVALQIYPMKEGAEIFATRIGGGVGRLSESGAPDFDVLRDGTSLFALASGAELTQALRYLGTLRTLRTLRLFSHSGGYILAVRAVGSAHPDGSLTELLPLSELGEELPSSLLPHIYEHLTELELQDG